MATATLLIMQGLVLAGRTAFLVCLLFPQDSLFKELGKAVERALGGGADDAPAAAMPAMAIEMPAQPGGPLPTERDAEEYAARVGAYAAAMEGWVCDRCELSPEAREALHQISAEYLKKELGSFAKTPDPQRPNRAFSQLLPVLFTSGAVAEAAVSARVERQLLTEFRAALTPEQVAALEAALSERQEFQSGCFVRYLAAMFDKELFLTSEQLDRLRATIADRRPAELHPLYAFAAQSYYLPYEPIGQLVKASAAKEILDRYQRDRLRDLQNQDAGSQHLTFMSNSGPDEWQRQILDAARTHREVLMRAAEVRISWLQREVQLTEHQAARLRLAAKGATLREVDDWKESTQATIDQMIQQMARFQGNFGFGAQNLDVSILDRNDLWVEALEEIRAAHNLQQLPDRSELLGDGMADSLTAVLDRELWLAPDQREPLRQLIRKSLPKSRASLQYQEYIRELILVAYPLFKSDAALRDRILSDSQRQVWTQMQVQFQWQPGNNSIQIQMRNQGGSFGINLTD